MAEILKLRSEVKALSYKNIKQYVKDVGLELPAHVTKGNCLKLIFKEGKFIEDPKEEIQGASPSTAEVKEAATSPTKPRGSVFNEDDFLKQDKSATRACNRFRNHFPILSQKIVRVLMNYIFISDLTPEDLQTAILTCDMKALSNDFVVEVGGLFQSIFPNDWANAINDEYTLGEDSHVKYVRFFAFLKIPNVMDRMLALAQLVSLQQTFDFQNTFTHNMHRALHEIVNDRSLGRYLIAVLLFSRAKNAQQINLSKMKLVWTGKSHGVCLLKHIMKALPVTAGDRFKAKNYDKIASKIKIRRKRIGDVMKNHFEKCEDGQLFETEDTKSDPEPAAPSLNALMSELTQKTVKIKSLDLSKKLKLKKPPPSPVDKTQQNLKRLEFRVPQYMIENQASLITSLQNNFQQNGFDSHLKMLERIELSYSRLTETNTQIMELWKEAERNYFDYFRTAYLKKIRDPEYLILSHIVEEEWGLYLPDQVWGDIWEFRTPFDEKIDLRFALEAYEDFVEEFGL